MFANMGLHQTRVLSLSWLLFVCVMVGSGCAAGATHCFAVSYVFGVIAGKCWVKEFNLSMILGYLKRTSSALLKLSMKLLVIVGFCEELLSILLGSVSLI